MLGAIAGDIIGSPYEFDRDRELAHSKKFPLVRDISHITDDSVMTLAVADALMKTFPEKGNVNSESESKFTFQVIKSMQEFGNKYPCASYGKEFIRWLASRNPQPYNSSGNGSAMRVSPVAWAFEDLAVVERFAELSSSVSHDNPEAIRAAKAVSSAVFMARTGKSKREIEDYICGTYYYDLSRSLDDIRPGFSHIEIAQFTVPEALTAFLESSGFEDTARNAVSLSGDSDTITAIACSIAEAFYGIPDEIANILLPKLDDYLRSVLERFDEWRA